jgi:zinc transport system substrate-binding protein
MNKIKKLQCVVFQSRITSICRVGLLLLFLLLLSTKSLVANPLEVFVSIPPQKYLIDRLGGKHVSSQVLIGEGKSPHLFQPTSRQVMVLSRAKLFFAMDMEFERALLAKFSQISSLQVINSVRGIKKIHLLGHDHRGEHHGGLDPHVWLSPPNLIRIATVMVEAMGRVDPGNLHYYKANLVALITELEALDNKIQAELAPFAGSSFYVFHPSFAYFARRYHLHQEAVEVGGKSPTPKQLGELIAKARKEQIKVIFVQAQFDPRSATAVAQAIDGEVVSLNPLAENVLENLKEMAAKIHTGLSN